MTPPVIHRVTTLDLSLQPWPWPFADERRADIEAHFARQAARKAEIWNGRMLLARDPDLPQGTSAPAISRPILRASWPGATGAFPTRSVFNGFGMGALRCADGAFVLGEMAGHTANAGRIYFPSGTPDLDDIKGEAVDIAGSVAREVEEETGLKPEEYRVSAHWDCVVTGAVIAMIRVLDVDLTGEALRARIEANLARQSQPELSAIHLVRERRDLTTAMPRFVTAFIEAQRWLHRSNQGGLNP